MTLSINKAKLNTGFPVAPGQAINYEFKYTFLKSLISSNKTETQNPFYIDPPYDIYIKMN